MKPSAAADAIPTRGRSPVFSNMRYRGTQSGSYFAFDRYSDSSWNHRDANTRNPRVARMIGPAPMRFTFGEDATHHGKVEQTFVCANAGASGHQAGNHEFHDPVV